MYNVNNLQLIVLICTCAMLLSIYVRGRLSITHHSHKPFSATRQHKTWLVLEVIPMTMLRILKFMADQTAMNAPIQILLIVIWTLILY